MEDLIDSTNKGYYYVFKGTGTYSVHIDDDERVCYAYLKNGRRIVGDVWLYNVERTPDSVDWNDQSQLPFLNSRQYCNEISVRFTTWDDLSCYWESRGVRIFYRGQLFAFIEDGMKPGRSRLAVKDGPLALTIGVCNEQ